MDDNFNIVNCFSISIYISNHILRDNHHVFGVFLILALVIIVLYYIFILTYQQHLLVDGVLSFVLLQICSSLNHVGRDYIYSLIFHDWLNPLTFHDCLNCLPLLRNLCLL